MPDKFFTLAGLVLRPFSDHILHCCVCGGGRGGGGWVIMFFFLFLFSSVLLKIK